MNQNKQKKREYSKIIVAWTLSATAICLIVSYVLAWMDKNPCTELAIALVGSAATVVDFYLHKSYKEKDSRNKYGIDEDGVPYSRYTEHTETDPKG